MTKNMLSNLQKQCDCFYDRMHILIDDPESPTHEIRLILVGVSGKLRVRVVVRLEVPDEKIRILSARKATKTECKQHDAV